MAKSRAQRKAERRKREAAQARQGTKARSEESRAQHDTQVPESADVVEAKLAEEGADLDTVAEPEAPEAEPAELEAPAPSRADEPEPADKISRRARKQQEREAKRKAKESEERRRPKDEPVERERGRVMGFLVSCVAELRRVQWPDRETLIQASAVTLLFIAIAAAYLGALDAVFNEVVQLVL
jgi:preprotein translocase SecE subunit